MDNKDKLIELARKLNELVKQGVGGEKENAGVLLENLMKKHRITMEDIEGIKKEKFEFSVDEKTKRLFWQIVGNTILDWDSQYYTVGRKRKTIRIVMTYAEYIEILAKYDLYSRDYLKQLEENNDIFLKAYLCKNNLYFSYSEEKRKKIEEANQKKKTDFKKILRINHTMQVIDKVNYHKQLEE